MNVPFILKAELIRVRKKLLIYILLIIYIFWATLMFVSKFTTVSTMIANGTATMSQYKQAFAWDSLPSTAGDFALCGWGAGFFIFLGAFWIGDDLDSKMIWNLAITGKKLKGIFFSKIISMCVFIIGFHAILILWLSFLSAVTYRVPEGTPYVLIAITNFIINSVIMFLFSLFGIFLSLLLNSAAFGSFLGFVLYVVCQFLTMGLYVDRYSLNQVAYSIQYHIFSGSSDQRILLIGQPQKSMILTPAVSGLLFFFYMAIFLFTGYHLYNKRAKN